MTSEWGPTSPKEQGGSQSMLEEEEAPPPHQVAEQQQQQLNQHHHRKPLAHKNSTTKSTTSTTTTTDAADARGAGGSSSSQSVGALPKKGGRTATRKGFGGSLRKVEDGELVEADTVTESQLYSPVAVATKSGDNGHSKSSTSAEAQPRSTCECPSAGAGQSGPTMTSTEQAQQQQQNSTAPPKNDRFSGFGSETRKHQESSAKAVAAYNPQNYEQVERPDYSGIGTRDDIDPTTGKGKKRKIVADAVWAFGDGLRNLKDKAKERKDRIGKKVGKFLDETIVGERKQVERNPK